MARYIRDVFTLEYKWVEDEPAHFTKPKAATDRPAFHVIRDLEPYKSPITDEVIGGRRQHREHMAAHGVIEMGNEKPKPRKRVEMAPAGPDVKQALEMLQAGYRPPPIDPKLD